MATIGCAEFALVREKGTPGRFNPGVPPTVADFSLESGRAKGHEVQEVWMGGWAWAINFRSSQIVFGFSKLGFGGMQEVQELWKGDLVWQSNRELLNL